MRLVLKISLVMSIVLSLVFMMNTANAGSPSKAPAIETEEIITNRVHAKDALNVGRVYFRSKADIQTVSGNVVSIHSLYTYPGGIATVTNISYSSSVASRYASTSYFWAISPYISGNESQSHYH